MPTERNLLLQIEAHTHTIIVFADVADGAHGLVGAHWGHGLDDGQNFLRLEEDADAVGISLGKSPELDNQTQHHAQGGADA